MSVYSKAMLGNINLQIIKNMEKKKIIENKLLI